MDQDEFDNHPRSYILGLIEEEILDPTRTVADLLYYISNDQCREFIEENDLQPQHACNECGDFFIMDDLEEEESHEGELFCETCLPIVRERAREDEDEDDSCPETDCDETLNDEGDCPKCSLEEGY